MSSQLTSVEIEIPNFSNFIGGGVYDAKIKDIEGKLKNHKHDICIETSEFNKLAHDVFKNMVKRDNLMIQS